MRRVGAVVCGLLLVVAAAGRAEATESYPKPPSGAWKVTGHGYGHGMGLSQYGARGAALAGLTAGRILDFYYPGTVGAGLAAGNLIRVKLSQLPTGSVTVYGGGGLRARDLGTGAVTPLADTTPLYRILGDATGQHLQYSRDNGQHWFGLALGGRTATAGTVLFESPAGVRVAYGRGVAREYEGSVALVRAGGAYTAVNVLTMERYLNGVVPREMPASWPAAALQAQAVAARTYAARGRSAAPTGQGWDTCDTTACQVYGGRRLIQGGTVTDLQPDASTDAVTATKDQVRTYGGQVITAYFGSSNGGWTMSGGTPYLPAKADPYDRTDNPKSTWTDTLTAAQVQACWPGLGALDRIEVLSRSVNRDRVLDVRLVGHTANGPTAVTTGGGAVRSCGGFPSSWFSLTAA